MSKIVKTEQDARLMVDEIENEEADELLLSIICMTCPYLEICGKGQEYNPITCVWLRDWLSASIVRWEEEYEYEDEDEDEN